jgi:hypothetical protein
MKYIIGLIILKHPEKLHLSAGTLVGNAFNAAFPCEEGA